MNIQNEIEVLKSRPLMERVVNKLNLRANYFVVGRIRTDNIYTNAPFRLEIKELYDSIFANAKPVSEFIDTLNTK